MSMGALKGAHLWACPRGEVVREGPLSPGLTRGTAHLASAVAWEAGECQMHPLLSGRAQVGGRDRLKGEGHLLVLVLGWREAEHPGWTVRKEPGASEG